MLVDKQMQRQKQTTHIQNAPDAYLMQPSMETNTAYEEFEKLSLYPCFWQYSEMLVSYFFFWLDCWGS